VRPRRPAAHCLGRRGAPTHSTGREYFDRRCLQGSRARSMESESRWVTARARLATAHARLVPRDRTAPIPIVRAVDADGHGILAAQRA
jgi:hypothetical protein